MERDIARLSGHVIVGRAGPVGRAVAGDLAGQGAAVVVVDVDPERVAEVPNPALIGDVTDDGVLRKAGIMRATALVAAINTDARERLRDIVRRGAAAGPCHRRPRPH